MWCIWQWWIPRRHDSSCHAFVIRLVVLSHLSIYAVEQVLYRLKNIRDACGDNIFEDIDELRVILQCNGDLEDLLGLLES